MGLGFSASADRAFKRLSAKEQDGLLRKLHAVAGAPHLAKPLLDDLKNHHRITYGRLRCVIRFAERQPALIVVYVGLRKNVSDDDVYAAAHDVLREERADIGALLGRLIKSAAEERKT